MPAKGKVNVNLQSILALIPIADLFASYRVKKLRLYLLIVWIPVIAIGNLVPHLMGYSERPLFMWEDCEPNWALFIFLDTCEPPDLQAFSVILAIGIMAAAVYLIRRWSKRWNKQFESTNISR